MYSSKHKQKPARACLISTPHDSSAEQIRWCHSLEMSSLRRPGPSTACEGLRGASHCSLYDHSSHTTLAFAHPLCPQLWECHLPSSLCGMPFPPANACHLLPRVYSDTAPVSVKSSSAHLHKTQRVAPYLRIGSTQPAWFLLTALIPAEILSIRMKFKENRCS